MTVVKENLGDCFENFVWFVFTVYQSFPGYLVQISVLSISNRKVNGNLVCTRVKREGGASV